MHELTKKLIAEFVGTFALVLVGTGAVILTDNYTMLWPTFFIAFCFGAIICLMIFLVGKISGAHFNPAVTIGFYLANRLPGALVFPYIMSQCLAAILASGLLKLIIDHPTYGATLPGLAVSANQLLVVETFLTFVLVLVILSITQFKIHLIYMAIVIGSTVFFEAYFAGHITGASMNPARTLGPALIAKKFAHLHYYFLAATIGGVSAAFLSKYIRAALQTRAA